MSGGSNPDPYYQADPPKREKVPKTYRDAVKPIKIERIQSKDKRGTKKIYYYKCEHCGEVFKTGIRKKHKRAFCSRNCNYEWQKYGKPTPEYSEEQRRAMAKRTREQWKDPEIRHKRVEGIREAAQTDEYRSKQSQIAKEVASRPEWKRKQSLAHKGKKRPSEVGRKVSKAKMGHEVTMEAREKISRALSGPKNPSYIDGRSSERQSFYRSYIWQQQRERVSERDKHTCQGCGRTEEEVGSLSGHHIEPLRTTKFDWADYPDELVVTLCKKCHNKSDSQPGRFKKPVNARGKTGHLERLNDDCPWDDFIEDMLQKEQKEKEEGRDHTAADD